MSRITSRREFIQNGLAFVSLGLAMPTFLMQAATADPAVSTPIPRGKALVVIEMSGGNDGLNTVIPYTDPNYLKYRPTIGIPEKDTLKIGSSLGLHPNLKGIKSLYDQGHVAVVTGVGYPNPNRSHFASMDFWQTGILEENTTERTGWVGRYFDDDGHYKGNPLSGVTLGGALPLALFAQNAPVSVIGSGNDYGFQQIGDYKKQFEALRALYAGGTVASSHAEFIRNVGLDAYSSTDRMKQAFESYDKTAADTAKYPQNGLAQGLQTVAKLILGDIGTKVYYLNMGGFDTHANQPRQHSNLMGILGNSLAAFFADLEKQGRASDVTVMTFSEFGRRTKENGSSGTDHGAASSLFIAGGGVKGGIYGDYPSLSDLDDGDLRFHTDFRSVYATLLDNWLGADSTKVLNGKYPHLGFV